MQFCRKAGTRYSEDPRQYRLDTTPAPRTALGRLVLKRKVRRSLVRGRNGWITPKFDKDILIKAVGEERE